MHLKTKQNKKNGVNKVYIRTELLKYFQRILRLNELDLLAAQAEHFIYSENFLSASPSASL